MAQSDTLDTGTRLAVDRTRLASERTMMAWVRTAASMISFGFTIYKFFDLEHPGTIRPDRVLGPRGFALLIIGTGIVALVMASIQHRSTYRQLEDAYGDMPRSVSARVAWLVALLGAFVWMTVLIRL